MALFFGDAGFFSVEYIIFAFRLETKEGGFPPSWLSGCVRPVYFLSLSAVSLKAKERKKVCP